MSARFGRFRLIERLGAGGMAEVWRASLDGPGGFQRTFALKRVLPHLASDPHFVRMFLEEARLSALLYHANVVQVFELGDLNGRLFLTMEFLDGIDLASALQQLHVVGPPPLGLGPLVARELCRALGYVHDLGDQSNKPLGLVHRDVSPSNVFLARDGTVKLLDFGIAKALHDRLDVNTGDGPLKGKLGYIAPELLEGKDVDRRADLYAVGVVLHESLAGVRLFKGRNDVEILDLVRAGATTPPSVSNHEVPAELDALCMRAVARDPDARFQTAAEMQAALDPIVARLGWGTTELTALLGELRPLTQTVPIVVTPTQDADVSPGANTDPDGGTVPGWGRTAERRSAWVRIALGLAIVVAAASVTFLLRGQRRDTLSAPPAVAAPPPAANPVAPPSQNALELAPGPIDAVRPIAPTATSEPPRRTTATPKKGKRKPGIREGEMVDPFQ